MPPSDAQRTTMRQAAEVLAPLLGAAPEDIGAWVLVAIDGQGKNMLYHISPNIPAQAVPAFLVYGATEYSKDIAEDN